MACVIVPACAYMMCVHDAHDGRTGGNVGDFSGVGLWLYRPILYTDAIFGLTPINVKIF